MGDCRSKSFLNVQSRRINKLILLPKAALLNLISGAVLAGSTHVGEFIAFRFVAGAGAFSILAAVPVCVDIGATRNTTD